jgi:predicted site-specific integrase-resolvase
VFRKDAYLKKHWGCSATTLWRMRKAGKLHSIKLLDGPYITSDEEIERIDSEPPRKSEPRGIAARNLEQSGPNPS